MGPYSITIKITTPEDAPSSAPVDIKFIFINSRTLFIQWGLIPLSDRNGIIIYYEVLVTTKEETYTYKTCDRNITIDSLQPSTTYNVSVAAFTNGRGPFSEPISITMPDDVPSGIPQSLSITSATATGLNISWNPPSEEDRNGDINGYIINVTNTDTLITTQFTTGNNDFSVNDLEPDTTYSLSVAARNANGTGPFTLPILIKTNQSAPSRPRRLRATAISPSSILLGWEPPANPNGEITAYHISITDEETGNVVIQETSNLTYVIITDLTPNNTYRCHVAAATTSMGPDSEYVFFNTEEDIPSASPSSVMSTVINSTAITVSWSPLNQSTTNGVIRHYKVSITNAVTGSEEILTTTNPNLTIAMLTPFTQYRVRVAAFTIGNGPYSNPITVVTAEDGTISTVAGSEQEEGTIAASVLAGLFGLILCLILCLLLLCCLCMSRRRRKRENDSNEYESTNNKMYINEYDPDNEMKELSPQNQNKKKASKKATTLSVNTSRPADYEYDTVTSPKEALINFEGNEGSSMMEVNLYFTDESSDEEEIKKK
uniref:Fibronectin type-III domain-containing protein n=2 Tax=Amphimedon queenslandica TaxID=400682 RepID=A0A1X7VJK8_AMPQE